VKSGLSGSRVVLGIDTSAYTTSACLVREDGFVLADCRQVLAVAPGRRGLRQSEAVFHHVRNLPALLAACFSRLEEKGAAAAVGVSTAPRDAPDSYMPVFVAGKSCAEAIAVAAGIPCWETSHQVGHFLAALGSLPAAARELIGRRPTLFVHASGGTTEVCAVRPYAEAPEEWPALCPVSATEDLTAGQLVDRAGVALGLPFPAGAVLEQLAAGGDAAQAHFPRAVRGDKLSFSGPAAAVERAIKDGLEPRHVAAGIYELLAGSFAAWLACLARKSGAGQLLFAGGVMASVRLQNLLAARAELAHLQLWFADRKFCTDNAVGPALFAAGRLSGRPLYSLAINPPPLPPSGEQE